MAYKIRIKLKQFRTHYLNIVSVCSASFQRTTAAEIPKTRLSCLSLLRYHHKHNF